MTTSTRAGLPLELFTTWLASGERGRSSEAIVAHLTGKRVGSHGRGDHPYDADDFRRCVLVLDHVDLARLAFYRMTDVSPEWAALATEPDRLAAYGPAVTAAKERIASAPEPPTITDLANEHAALAEIFSHGAVIPTPSKEHPMPETTVLPEGLTWKTPPAAAIARSLGSNTRSKNRAAAAAARSKPREWLCLGMVAASGAVRWRRGEIEGTTPGEFEAVVDTGAGKGTKGDLYIRYVGAPK